MQHQQRVNLARPLILCLPAVPGMDDIRVIESSQNLVSPKKIWQMIYLNYYSPLYLEGKVSETQDLKINSLDAKSG